MRLAWLALLGLMLAGCMTPGQALARHGLNAPFTQCPNGFADPFDGCLQAHLNGSTKFSNFFTAVAPQSGQTYFSSNPNSAWNAPGIQYPIGPYTSRAAANDPMDPYYRPSTCTPTSYASANPAYPNYNVLTCARTNTSHLWQNLDFGAWSAHLAHDGVTTIAAHGPTFVYFLPATAAGYQTFDDVWFTESADCPSPTATLNTWIYTQTGQTQNFTLQDFSYDGALATCRPSIALGDTALIPVSFFTSGNALIQYGIMQNVTGSRFFSIICSNTSVVCAVRFDMFHNWAPHPAGGHGELDSLGPATGQAPNVSMDHFVAWNDVGVSAATSTTLVYLSNGNSGAFGTLTLDHAILIANTITGGVATKKATIGYSVGNSPSGGTGSGPGYYLTVNSLSAGAVVATGEAVGALGVIDANVSGGTGVGSIWTVACPSPYTGCTTALNQGQYSSVWMANTQGTFTNQPLTDNTVGPCAEAAHNSYGHIVITNTLCDLTGGNSGVSGIGGTGVEAWEAISLSAGACAIPATLAGNQDLLTGNPLNTWSVTSNGC